MTPTQSGLEDFVRRLTEITEANLAMDGFGVSVLAREMRMSRSNLHRKLKYATGTSVSNFICQVRLKKAKELLENSSSSISDIAFDCGFSSTTYFNKCFRDQYGFTPGKIREGGSDSIKPEGVRQKSGIAGWGNKKVSFTFLISVIFGCVAAIALLFIFKPFLARERHPEKSIAVLPFMNDSPDETEMYFINGAMEAILHNLSLIGELRVVGRNSVEQYRGLHLPAVEIAKELNVSYLLEGCGQKYGDKIRLTIQLIDGTRDGHIIWSGEYIREIRHIEELFMLLSEIAKLVANEIEATITPKENELIGNIPTRSSIAYEFRERGKEEYYKYLNDASNIIALQKAEELFRFSLEYDSMYALPYLDIARIYFYRQSWDIDRSDSYLDTVWKYVERAVQYDDQLGAAYMLMGNYYLEMGEQDKALKALHRSAELNPNNLEYFLGRASINWQTDDYVGILENYHTLLSIYGSMETVQFLGTLSTVYLLSGFKDQSDYYAKKALDLGGDSASYYAKLGLTEYLIRNNIPGAVELLQKGYALDPANVRILKHLGEIYLERGERERSLQYLESYAKNLDALKQIDLYGTFVIGYAYLLNGNRDSAEYYFDLQAKYSNKKLRSNPKHHLQLAMISAWRGEREAAIEHLRIFNQVERVNVYVVRNLKEDLFFESIQDDPRYLEIKDDLIAKFQAEYERVRKWLAKNEML